MATLSLPKVTDPQYTAFNLLDLREALAVEIVRDETNKLWINLNGKCLLRIGKLKYLEFQDRGTQEEPTVSEAV